MTDAELVGALAELGIDQFCPQMMALWPFVELAWTDERVTEEHREKLLLLVQSRRMGGDSGVRTLQDWLSFRPSGRYLAGGHDLANELIRRRSLQSDEHPDLVTTCQQLAEEAASLLGRDLAEIPRDVLSEVGALLFVSPEATWPDLDKQLGQTVVMMSPFSEIDGDYDDLDIPEGLRSAVRALHEEPVTDAPAVLIFMDKSGERTYPIKGDEVTIGRGPDNDIVLFDDVRVSRHHCRVVRRGSEYFVVDRDSANGTHVDGQFVVECQLSGGEQIAIGDSVFAFRRHARTSGQ
jgi:hypothetical protein